MTNRPTDTGWAELVRRATGKLGCSDQVTKELDEFVKNAGARPEVLSTLATAFYYFTRAMATRVGHRNETGYASRALRELIQALDRNMGDAFGLSPMALSMDEGGIERCPSNAPDGATQGMWIEKVSTCDGTEFVLTAFSSYSLWTFRICTTDDTMVSALTNLVESIAPDMMGKKVVSGCTYNGLPVWLLDTSSNKLHLPAEAVKFVRSAEYR